MAEAQSSQFAELAGLEQALGHKFVRPDLLLHALTHRSQSFESAMNPHLDQVDHRSDNERLEFLGDAVLGMVVAESLFRSHPDCQEGELTRLRAQLVSRKHMGEVALSIGLGHYLRLGKGEERSGGRKKAAILANAMEAVIAALYLDGHAATPGGVKSKATQGGTPISSGDGLAAVRSFAERHILGIAAEDLARELRSGAALGDHKSALQELLQANHAGTPIYSVASESGPDHRKRFQVELRVKTAGGKTGEPLSLGAGSTKKKAEQEAARHALAILASAAAANGISLEEPATV